ncbi:protein seele-like [Daphnia carinata]|uniref:protein seele-like n=1 Tax=Daphnia carinata TaxID=120202 RepID=UPI00257C31A1|nr:protein seele-like [Daphnia carinata]
MNLVSVTCFVFAFMVVLTSANEPNDYTNGNFAVPDVPKREILRCMVCKALVDEVEIAVDKVDPHKKVDMGSFRLDGQGNVKQNLVPYARSELFLSEVMDKVCPMFRNYVVASYKATGIPTLLRIETPDGKGMNPEMSNVNIVPNPEVNEQLSSYCQSLVEEFEDDIVSMFAKSEKQLHEKLCVTVAEVCPKDAVPDADDSSSESSDDFDFDREEL